MPLAALSFTLTKIIAAKNGVVKIARPLHPPRGNTSTAMVFRGFYNNARKCYSLSKKIVLLLKKKLKKVSATG